MDETQKTVIGVATIAAIVVAAIIISVNLHSTGTITGIGLAIYNDQACTTKISSIDWGNINLGESKQVILYLKNTGNINAALNMTNTPPPSGCSLTWNQEGKTLTPNTPIKAVLTLNATAAAKLGNFNIDITLSAKQI